MLTTLSLKYCRLSHSWAHWVIYEHWHFFQNYTFLVLKRFRTQINNEKGYMTKLIWKLTATVKKHTCPLKFFEILEDRDFWLQFNEATQIPFTSHFLHILINKFKGEGFFYTFDQHDHLLRRHVWIKWCFLFSVSCLFA